MPTVPYDTAMRDMVKDKPEIGLEMLEGALNSLLAGEVDDGRILLREYVNVTIGFQELARRTGKHDKNLMRSLSATGNPTAANLFEIIHACAADQGMTITAHVERERPASPAPA